MYVIRVDSESSLAELAAGFIAVTLITDKDSGALFALAIRREPGVLRHITGKQGPLDHLPPSTSHDHRVSHLGLARAGYLRERQS